MARGWEAQRDAPFARLPIAWSLVVLVPIGIAWPLRSLLRTSNPSLFTAQPLLPFVIISLIYLVLFTFAWSTLRRRGFTPPMLGICRPAGNQWALALAGALAGILLIYPAVKLIAGALSLEMPGTIAFSANDLLSVSGAIVVLGLVIPLAEEVLFRGFLLSLLRQHLGTWFRAALIGAILFAVPHWPRMGTGGVLFIFLWSAVPITLFIVTRNIFVSGGAHMINNLFAYVALPLLLTRPA